MSAQEEQNEKELEQIVEDAFGSKDLSPTRNNYFSSSKQTESSVLERYRRIGGELVEEGSIDFKPVLWEEIHAMEFPEARWKIKGLIPISGQVILAAISGEGKTWIALEMAWAIAQGKKFLNTIETVQGKVLYIDAENPLSDIQRRGRQLGFENNENLLFLPIDSLNLNKAAQVKALISLIEEKEINVIFIDTFRSVDGGINEDRAEEIRKIFNQFNSLKNQNKAIVWLDHLRKPNHFEGKVLKKEQLLGSQDKTASVEVLIMLKNDGRGNIAVYQPKNRLQPEISPFTINMIDEEVDGVINTTLTYGGEIDEQETKKEEAKELILHFLAEESKISTEILDYLKTEKIGGRNGRDALKELEKEEKVLVTKEGRKNLYSLQNGNSIYTSATLP